MARIPYFDPALATGKAQTLFANLPDLNIFRMMGHGGNLLYGFLQLGNTLLFRGRLDPVLREIAIIRVGVLSGCEYEIQQHRDIGRRLGVSDALLDAVSDGPTSATLSEDQRLVVLFTDDLFAHVRSSDEFFSAAVERFGPGVVQELVIVVGYYMMTARFIETFEVDLERHGGPIGGDLLDTAQARGGAE